MPRGSGSERERRYARIEESAQDRGESPERAKEIAARTVDRDRPIPGEDS